MLQQQHWYVCEILPSSTHQIHAGFKGLKSQIEISTGAIDLTRLLAFPPDIPFKL